MNDLSMLLIEKQPIIIGELYELNLINGKFINMHEQTFVIALSKPSFILFTNPVMNQASTARILLYYKNQIDLFEATYSSYEKPIIWSKQSKQNMKWYEVGRWSGLNYKSLMNKNQNTP